MRGRIPGIQIWLPTCGHSFVGVAVLALAILVIAMQPQAAAGSASGSLYGPLPPDVQLTGDAAADRLYVAAYRAEQGLSRLRDVPAAVHLYCAAARKGHPGAAYRLGWLFLHGNGVSANDDQAAAWLARAAESGSRAAQGLLGLIPNARPESRASCQSGRTVPSQSRSATRVKAPRAIRELVEPLARRRDLDPELVLSIIAVESGFNPLAVSPKNAQGLMQLIPETAARFGVREPFDVRENVIGGVEYLAWLVDRFDGQLDKVLAAYNAGEGAVSKYSGVPPYAETQNYVQKVRRLYGVE